MIALARAGELVPRPIGLARCVSSRTNSPARIASAARFAPETIVAISLTSCAVRERSSDAARPVPDAVRRETSRPASRSYGEVTASVPGTCSVDDLRACLCPDWRRLRDRSVRVRSPKTRNGADGVLTDRSRAGRAGVGWRPFVQPIPLGDNGPLSSAAVVEPSARRATSRRRRQPVDVGRGGPSATCPRARGCGRQRRRSCRA